MTNIAVTNTGILYKNPIPHVRSVHAYFPSVVRLTNDELLATIVLGEAFEATNLHTHLCRSTDQGQSWTLQGPLHTPPADRLTSDSARLTALPDGHVVAFIARHDRTDHPNEGLSNPETLGFVPTDLLLSRSTDVGRTWTAPERLTPPLVGPSFEMCSPITVLSDGRWLLPTSTWSGWDGRCPNGIKMVAFVSSDQGRTWPVYSTVMHQPDRRVYFWESKIVELPDGRLLAVAWAYDEAASADLPNQYALSNDGGKTWSSPTSTGLQGQTLTPLVLDGGRILSLYRRMDRPGLWANLAHLEADRWINENDQPLWGADLAGLTAATENMAYNFNVLRFGAPSMTALADASVFAAFWCYEDCVSIIRWFKLDVT